MGSSDLLGSYGVYGVHLHRLFKDGAGILNGAKQERPFLLTTKAASSYNDLNEYMATVFHASFGRF
jgi:hypothetical protein